MTRSAYQATGQFASRDGYRSDHVRISAGMDWPSTIRHIDRRTVDTTRPDTSAWADQAACRGTDPDVFFPERGDRGQRPAAEARRLCASCPVRVECLDYAIQAKERWGIWGGLTATELRRARKLNRERGLTAAQILDRGLVA